MAEPDTKQKALAAIEVLTLSDVHQFFYDRASERDKQIADMLETKDGDIECDGAIVSEGDDNGAYVMCWRWVDFAGTSLDKESEEEEEAVSG